MEDEFHNKLYKEKIADNQPLLFIENYKISDVWGGWQSERGEQLDLKDGWVDLCPKCQK